MTGLALGLASAAGLALLYAVVIAPRRLALTSVEVPIRGLAPAFDGYTIVVLSDIHHGAVMRPRRHLARMVALTRAIAPDLIALLGDYGISHRRFPRLSARAYRWAMGELEPTFRALHARDGVVAVLGNHDYDYDGCAVAEWLAGLGIRVLVNRAVVVARGDARLAVGGVDDATSGRVDPLAGCAEIPSTVPRLVLAHSPDAILSLAPASEARVDLVLSGHTHGGQVVLPLVGALARRSRICGRWSASGWVPNPRAPLYVTTGIGVMLPIRVNCPPEVLVVRLSSERAQRRSS